VIPGPSELSKKKGASAPFSDLPAAPAVAPATMPTPRTAEEPRSTVEAVCTVIVGSPPAPAPGITYPAHLNSGAGKPIDMGQSIRHGGCSGGESGDAPQCDQAEKDSSKFHPISPPNLYTGKNARGVGEVSVLCEFNCLLRSSLAAMHPAEATTPERDGGDPSAANR